MSDLTDDSVARTEEKRRQSRRGPLLLATGLVAMSLGALWVMRAPLAENLIERELAARHVRMSYRIASIGLRTQRIEDIVLGDPGRPDLTARWVEVDVSFAGLAPTVAAVRAGGVRLRGAFHDGALSLGELDKFRSTAPAKDNGLPDIRVALSNSWASIATDYGPLTIGVDGAGGLQDGFMGKAVLAMPLARAGGCVVDRPHAILDIAMRAGAPHAKGPVTAQALACRESDIAVVRPVVQLDGRLDKTFVSLDASAAWTAAAMRGAGLSFDRPRGSLALAGNVARFAGHGRLGSGALGNGVAVAAGSDLSFAVKGGQARGGAVDMAFDGDLRLRNLTARGREPLGGLGKAAAGTPLAPLAVKLAQAVRDAGRGNVFRTHVAVRNGAAGGEATLSDLHFAADSGARIDLPSDGRVAIGWPQGGMRVAGAVSMGGGGLPEGTLSLAGDDRRGLSGVLDVSPYAANGARLALAPVRFSAAPDGSTRFMTSVTLDGPLADGAVKGLTAPVSGAVGRDGAFAINAQCAPVAWQALRVSTLALDSARVTLCPAEGGAMLRRVAGRLTGGATTRDIGLNGRIGSSPLALKAATFAFSLSRPGFRAGGLDVRIGRDDAPVSLAAQAFDGAIDGEGVAGRFDGGRGRIGAVPLDLSDMAGRWRFAGGRLDVDGALRVSDVAPAPRFNPVVSRDAHLALEGGRITANGRLRHPSRGAALASVNIAHDLSSGNGEARFALTSLRFDGALQPDDLTPLALGVVANVQGAVEGDGRIRWTPAGVTSAGRFSTQGMDLAAAFGPVQGLSTTLNFTDLLAMETAPGQEARLKTVNPGVEVHDGVVRFQLLANSRARIEGGAWPFAGGELALLPSTMDFDAKGARNLIFRVTGLDAGAFINTMDLKNISATGSYDGLLPMVFDATGGRIVGGILVARQQGMPPLIVEDARKLTVPCDPLREAGTLSYVGDVSNADMGTYGKLAFDALKKLKYKCLTILLDGALDGEFVTRVAINGVNQGTEESQRSAIARSFLGIPFLFNVRIEAPFRGLLNTYQSFVDPSALVRGSLGPQYKTVLENRLAVQPADSDKGVAREHE